MKALPFFVIFFLFSFYFSHAQVFELNIAPSITFPDIIKDNSFSKRAYRYLESPGYILSATAYSNVSKIQVGLRMKHQFTNFGVYFSYTYPLDAANGTTSKLKISNESFKLGLGGVIRYNMPFLKLEADFTYNSSLSNTTKGCMDVGYDDSTEEWPYQEYTSGKGISIGLSGMKDINNKFAIGLAYDYCFYNQHYVDETFLHDWTVNPMSISLVVGYKLN